MDSEEDSLAFRAVSEGNCKVLSYLRAWENKKVAFALAFFVRASITVEAESKTWVLEWFHYSA